MNMPKEVIEATKRLNARTLITEDERVLMRYLLGLSGELPEGEPPLVQVPDCFMEDYCITRDKGGDIYLSDDNLEKASGYWSVPDGVSAIRIFESDDLVLPDVEWSEACWRVSELREMAAARKHWESKQVDPEDEYIVWGPGELPERFRDMKRALEELQIKGAEKWISVSCGGCWRTYSYRMKQADYERLRRKEPSVAEDIKHGLEEFRDLVEHTSIEQLKKDHAAMERLRSREAAGVWLETATGTFRANVARFVATPDVYSKDPADAILAVKGGE